MPIIKDCQEYYMIILILEFMEGMTKMILVKNTHLVLLRNRICHTNVQL